VLRAWIAAFNWRRGILCFAIAFKEVIESTSKHRNLTLQICYGDTDAIEKKSTPRFFHLNIVVDVSPERIVSSSISKQVVIA
jgi:two-component system CheB/CheR fusion protein